jgi:hypothetical protein
MEETSSGATLPPNKKFKMTIETNENDTTFRLVDLNDNTEIASTTFVNITTFPRPMPVLEFTTPPTGEMAVFLQKENFQSRFLKRMWQRILDEDITITRLCVLNLSILMVRRLMCLLKKA